MKRAEAARSAPATNAVGRRVVLISLMAPEATETNVGRRRRRGLEIGVSSVVVLCVWFRHSNGKYILQQLLILPWARRSVPPGEHVVGRDWVLERREESSEGGNSRRSQTTKNSVQIKILWTFVFQDISEEYIESKYYIFGIYFDGTQIYSIEGMFLCDSSG